MRLGIPGLILASLVLWFAVHLTSNTPGRFVSGSEIQNVRPGDEPLVGRLQASVLEVREGWARQGTTIILRAADNVQVVGYLSSEAGGKNVMLHQRVELQGHTDTPGVWMIDVPGAVTKQASTEVPVDVVSGCIKDEALLPYLEPAPGIPDGCYGRLVVYQHGSITKRTVRLQEET